MAAEGTPPPEVREGRDPAIVPRPEDAHESPPPHDPDKTQDDALDNDDDDFPAGEGAITGI